MKIRSLQSRIIIFFVLLMLILQVGGLVLTNEIGVTNARRTIGEELVTGERVFERLLDQDALRVTQAVRILASDFAFREALATHDKQTITSALQNHGARVNAQVMMLVGLDHQILADVSGGVPEGENFPLPKMLAEAEEQGKSAAIVVLNGRLYQVVAVPVLAPLPTGWVVMGFALDDAVVRDLKNLTGLDVSFAVESPGGPWKVQASTLAPNLKAELAKALGSGIHPDNTIQPSDREDDETLGIVFRPPSYESTSVVAVLQKPLSSALESFRRMQNRLLGFSLFGILISVMGSIAIAGGIARPVRELARSAGRIAAGDYSDLPSIERDDEIGELSQAFAHMRDGIASRESRIMDLAYSDTLTGLANRALFNDRLTQAIARAQRAKAPLTVLIMDLDHFKWVNDTLGHHVGDLLLREVANRLSQALKRKTDTLARMGGDEFAMLLPSDDSAGAMLVALALLESLESPMNLEGHMVDTRASIGMASFPDNGEDAESLMRRADVAMYQAKRTNSGVAAYQARDDQHSADRLSLMSELRKAVEHDELVLHYQPKIGMQERGAHYVEALIRWRHPERGFIQPATFIPFAEQTGYIKTITLWVLDRAVAQCAQWRAAGLDINVSVNISARDVANPDLPGRFEQLLKQHACKPEWICLEITESAVLDDHGHALISLDRLAALGCGLSIDDYGTGYSSLSYLKRLPVNELKIDKSFVMGMATNVSDTVIVRSTIDLAHNMGLVVVAEGVEDQACLERLREMGCDMAQGFIFSPAVPPEELANWLLRSSWTRNAA
jgi:diguanylate cyclase (GGDEF)-like protein